MRPMDLSETYFHTGEVRLHVMEGPRNGPPLLLLQADPAKQGCLLDPDLALIQAQVPAARRIYFPGVGHGIHSERPQEVTKVFEEFIYGIEAGPGLG